MQDHDAQEEQEEKRYTTVHSRFQVGHNEDGFLEAFSTRRDAMGYAERWDNPTLSGYASGGIGVHDIMARKGRPNFWRLTSSRKWIAETI